VVVCLPAGDDEVVRSVILVHDEIRKQTSASRKMHEFKPAIHPSLEC
jgi:hypothetical protein